MALLVNPSGEITLFLLIKLTTSPDRLTKHRDAPSTLINPDRELPIDGTTLPTMTLTHLGARGRVIPTAALGTTYLEM